LLAYARYHILNHIWTKAEEKENMMNGFKDARIALLEARMSSEMADLVRRQGGNPYNVPAVREVPIESKKEVSVFIDHLTQGKIPIAVFFTGVGVKALFNEAEQLGRLSELQAALHQITVVCRGPKPGAVLKRANIPIALSAVEPYTTEELLQALLTLDLSGKTVGVLHYGERNELFTNVLRERGASLEELCLYEWLLPEDLTRLQTLVHEIIDGEVDAVVFTSQVQIRHLFLVAEDMHLTDELKTALNSRTIVASVGPTCTGVLHHYEVTPHVIPGHPKMGHLVKALAEYMA
jgi:uroporphyrinogen-III synthase